MQTKAGWCLATGVAVGVLVFQTQAQAQAQARAPEISPQEPATALDEVVVTALKRDTTLQTTPMAISAVTEQTLLRQGVSNFSDMVRSFPGLNVTEDQPGQRRLTIRGVQGAGENTVGLYYGETPVTGPTSATSDPSLMSPDLNLFDVNRVEVLRGPQGTLYGAGSVGGTMRIIFNEPDSTAYAGAIDAGISTVKGGGEGYSLRGMINVPLLADRLAARAVLYRHERAGWVDNVTLSQNDVNSGVSEGGRFMLAFTPNDKVKVVANAHVQSETIDDSNGWFPSVGTYKTDMEIKAPFESQFNLYNVTTSADLGRAQLTVSSSFYRWEALRTYDQTRNQYAYRDRGTYCRGYYGISVACTPAQLAGYRTYVESQLPIVGYQPMGLDTWTHEARLTGSSLGDRLDWTVGAFYEKRADDAASIVYRADAESGLPLFPYQLASRRFINVDTEQTAVFGELSYKLTDALTVTAGLRRYAYDKLTRVQIDDSVTDPALFATSSAPDLSTPADADGWVKKLNVSYQAAPSVLVYAQASEGFRPGGANVSSILPSDLVVFYSDSLTSYETGIRSTWRGWLTVNAAAYLIDWSDMQIKANIPSAAFVTNAGAAEITGIEFEISARPVQGLFLRATLNAMNAELVEDQATSSVSAPGLKGDRIPYEPELTGSIVAQYNWPVAGSIDGMVRADYAYTGTSYTALRPTDSFYEEMGGFGSLNLRIGLEGEDWGVYAYVENLFDKVGVNRVRSATNIEQYSFGIAPRTLGFSLNRRF